MQWHEAVFSERPAKRLLRHAVFWTAWWLYFSMCFYYLQQPQPGRIRPLYVTVGSYLLTKTLLLVFLYAIASYAFIYLLLPQVIKGKWLKAAVNTSLLGVILFTGAYFMYWQVFPHIDSLFGLHRPNRFVTRFWPAVSLGLIDPLKVITAAAIIKYIKYWWLKQKESEKLEKEKINAELQLLKAQIHPNFLFTALNNIYAFSLAASPHASEMLLKLSDLLSYMLYECDEPLVPLEKEVGMMKDYIALEKIRLDRSIEVEFSVRGDMAGKMIAPFLLLPFIESSFKHIGSSTEHAWMNMDINMEGDTFSMKLANGILTELTGFAFPENGFAFPENGLADAQKRLHLIYPQKHELKMAWEREMLIVLLKIDLAGTALTLLKENDDKLMMEPLKR